MSEATQMRNEIIEALLDDEDDEEGIGKELTGPSEELLNSQLSELLPEIVRAKEIYLEKPCIRTVEHTNSKGETYIFGRFGRRNHVMSTLLYLDPRKGWVPADPGFTYGGMLRHTIGEDIEDDEEFKEVYGGEEKKYLPLGSVSTATMRAEDLIPRFISALRSVNTESADILEEEYEGMLDKDDPDFCWEQVVPELEKYVPPYAYFGSHPGDGADYGVWVSPETLDDDLKYEYTDDLRAMRKGDRFMPGSRYVVVLDERGEYVALLDGLTGREIWSI